MRYRLQTFIALFVFICIGAPTLTRAQEQSAAYVNQTDDDLTIRRVAVWPATDNTDGIYARPTETQLIKLVRDSHRWDYVDSSAAGSIPSLIELEENPAQVKKLLAPVEVDAVIAAALSKGPDGLSLRIDLFMKKDGKLLAQEIVRDLRRFELAEVRDQINQLYRRLLTKIPYDGLILSRQGNRVTLNLGKSDGLVKDQTVTAVQIITVNRHPKFNFLISSDKEILGTIRVLKVDETLSFGAIVSEKERGAIRRLAKIAGVTAVNYGVPANLDEKNASDVSSRPDSNVAFGNTPREWLPVHPPTFGAVGAKLGLGSYSTSVSLNTGSLDAKTALYPSLNLWGELWLNPEWTIRADINQGIVNTPNPRPGSQPPELNHLMSRYSLEIDYNFLLRDDFFGPKLNLGVGFMTYRMYVDDSTPTGLTTLNYSGLLLGFGGSFPVTDDNLWYAGGRLNLFVFTSLNESPKTSGSSSKNSINDFSVFVERKIAENIRVTGGVEFSLFSTSFSGQGSRVDENGIAETASSVSQKHTMVTGGIVYMF